MPEPNLSYLLNLKPEEIIKWFESKGSVISWDWKDVYAQAHSRAFTVAKVMKLDILQTIRDEAKKIFSQGTTPQEFRKNLEPILKTLGWWGKQKAKDVPGFDPKSGTDPDKVVQLGSPYRLEKIFRINSSVAYNSARYKFQMDNISTHPYLKYIQIQRPSKRDEHAQYNGKVFRADDPIWNIIYPPSDWECFPGGTPIATNDGWKPIEKIKRGELVLGGSGEYRLVNTVFRRKFNGNIIRFITKNGSAASTPNHRILTLRGWIGAEHLKVGDILVQIPQIFSIKNSIGNIDSPNTSESKIFVSLPTKWKPAVRDAVKPKFQFRDQNIYPEWCYGKIKFRFISKFVQMLYQFNFVSTWFKPIVRMQTFIKNITKFLGSSKFFLHFSSMRRSIKFKFISLIPNQFTILFCKSSPRMFVSLPMFFEKLRLSFGRFFSPFFVVHPLRFYSLASSSGFDIKMLKQSDDCARLHFPSSTKHVVAEKFIKIENFEGLSSGAPLDCFDSIESFRRYALDHLITEEIIDILNIQYSGIVYNLEVDKDNTYVIPTAVVHNCGCRVVGKSKDDLKQEGLAISKGKEFDTSSIPDEWAHNPGKSFEPDLSKYDKDLVEQYLRAKS